MDIGDIGRLRTLNNDFYRSTSASFSATRKGGWPGWRRVADALPRRNDIIALLDVACGNMRFERYLAQALPAVRFAFTCLDACEQLAGDTAGLSFGKCDVIGQLLEKAPLVDGAGKFDAAVTFGFMHHVPTASLRRRLLEEMLRSVRSGGLVACSLWRFAEEESLKRRAQATTEEALERVTVSLEEGDYLVGWDARPGIYRYCHSFSGEDAEELIELAASFAVLSQRYLSDGRNGEMNEYLVFSRKP